ncbi:aminotransferase family protein [Halalkalibacterium halodurans]|uniref:aminotransferase family protein n=1 Tax=Halalkalibacterium halodurans TaxID=86665 RepID=UPI002AAA295C|nr:aspartate aminotransferase family protein [Halalkalibacterium halodurans]MDY7221571.1 aspartate aminotransferase family protein [Halalkalibacterium halodurans]MDY7240847.1 aspartate aminotransferase family protein [Halalkalibacterium halodurans]
MKKNDETSRNLIGLDQQHFIHPTSSMQQQQQHGPAHIFVRGKGVYLYDHDGKAYLDGMSSLWNVNVGHGRRELGEVAKKQMDTLAFSSCFATFSNKPAIELAAKLARVSPPSLRATFFTSGGSEANDTAFKLARHYWKVKDQPKKRKIIARMKSYHGVAMGATSATGLKPFRDFAPSLAPDFLHVDHMSIEALRALIEREGPETIAAFVCEPIQGAGGVHVAPDSYLCDIRSICDEYELLFIADEVITGFGRTGAYFGCDHANISPDMMCIAKGITSGYAPLGGVMLSKSLHEQLTAHSHDTLLHGYTYSGHPTSCAVALKNIQIIEEENLIDHAATMGEKLLLGFRTIQEQYSEIHDARGRGLMAALAFSHNGKNEPLAPKVVQAADQRGLILRAVTFDQQDVLVCAPPLIINEEELNQLLSILESSVQAVVS